VKPQHVHATIAAQWRSYRNDVMPVNAGPTQLQETRRAFYAAANSMLQVMLHIVAADEDDDVGVQILQAMHNECAEFSRAVARGEA
jgi:hypothetical protein